MNIQLAEIPVKLRKSPLAKRVSIRIRQGNVTLVVPKRASMSRAVKFLNSKEEWVRTTLQKQPQKIALSIGSEIPVLGTLHKVEYAGMCGKSGVVDGKIIICGDEKLAAKKIKKVLSEFVKAEITEAANQKSAQINKKFSKISIRETSSRWGSCARSGNLSFSWRIVFAPREVMEYLVSHEVAHLAEMNHSKRFWAVVESLCPRYKILRAWLAKNGSKLHLYS